MSVLVTGTSGALGSAITRTWTGDDPIAGLCRRPRLGRLPWFQADITDETALRKAFAQLEPRICIHCAALADVDACERQPLLAHAVNVEGTRNVAEECRAGGVRLISISTDYVFGDDGISWHDESAATDPVQVYGNTKLASEREAARVDSHLVVRLPLLYGWEVAGSWLARSWNALRAGTQVLADVRHVRQPALIADVARTIIRLSKSDAEGVIHVAPRQLITKYAWSVEMADVIGVPKDLVLTSTGDGVRRPVRSALATTRLDSMGIEIPRSVSEVLRDPLFLREGATTGQFDDSRES